MQVYINAIQQEDQSPVDSRLENFFKEDDYWKLAAYVQAAYFAHKHASMINS